MVMSIGIGARNRSQALGHTLRAIAELNIPAGELEVVVVNNASTDKTSFNLAIAAWKKLPVGLATWLGTSIVRCIP